MNLKKHISLLFVVSAFAWGFNCGGGPANTGGTGGNAGGGGDGGGGGGIPNLVECGGFAYNPVSEPPVNTDGTATFRGTSYDCAAYNTEAVRCATGPSAPSPTYAFACCECDTVDGDGSSCNALPEPCPGTVLSPDDPICLADPTNANCAPPVVGPGAVAETCMSCHNGAARDDYSGPGLSNPHPFVGAALTRCTQCHGGNPAGAGRAGSHVPPPPGICPNPDPAACDAYLIANPQSYFNFLTLAGLDNQTLFPPWGSNPANGNNPYTVLDYLQFRNPGDIRIVSQGKSCGMAGCHAGAHVDSFMRGPIAYEMGIFGGASYSAGIPNALGRDWYEDTAADYGFRPQTGSPLATESLTNTGQVPNTIGVPEVAQYDANLVGISGYGLLPAANLNADVVPTAGASLNRIASANSDLAQVYREQITITCGDCHAGSAGANNRFADFRSSGCSACHMQYSLDGRSRSTDPNVNKAEPANADAIAAPERPHVEMHMIRNVAKFQGGTFVRGISDTACVGCHQGSNRTVLQYWGIRLDQNADLANNFQYPANPNTFVNTAQDFRLFDPAVQNATFNGRNANQYILFEDYDGDARDDTPPDVHYAAGLGCIDCHGREDTHNMPDGGATGELMSHMDQVVKIECESCHGGIEAYAEYGTCTLQDGTTASCAKDKAGNYLDNVTRDPQGNIWLKSRLNGTVHYVPQTKDTIDLSVTKVNPINQQAIYSAKASYAMGRIDTNIANGQGPIQTNPAIFSTVGGNGFAHTDSMDCVSCHAAWVNNCNGCHLRTQYDANPANFFFSNLTGERIILKQQNADFTYISPIQFRMGVNSHGRISSVSPSMQVFYEYRDNNFNAANFNGASNVFAFSDRSGMGNNPNYLQAGAFGALSHNQLMPHSIRGKVTATDEGPRYCVQCHLNVDQIDNFGADYAVFRNALATRTYADLDFAELQTQIGLNTGNQNNSPYFVHMAAGLGTGLMLFDQFGCPVNPLDNRTAATRPICARTAVTNNLDPNAVTVADLFNTLGATARAVYDLDRTVEANGKSNAGNNHPIQIGGLTTPEAIAVSQMRDGAQNPLLAGPMGGTLVQRLTDPALLLVLDSWLDANGNAQGDAANYILNQ